MSKPVCHSPDCNCSTIVLHTPLFKNSQTALLSNHRQETKELKMIHTHTRAHTHTHTHTHTHMFRDIFISISCLQYISTLTDVCGRVDVCLRAHVCVSRSEEHTSELQSHLNRV